MISRSLIRSELIILYKKFFLVGVTKDLDPYLRTNLQIAKTSTQSWYNDQAVHRKNKTEVTDVEFLTATLNAIANTCLEQSLSYPQDVLEFVAKNELPTISRLLREPLESLLDDLIDKRVDCIGPDTASACNITPGECCDYICACVCKHPVLCLFGFVGVMALTDWLYAAFGESDNHLIILAFPIVVLSGFFFQVWINIFMNNLGMPRCVFNLFYFFIIFSLFWLWSIWEDRVAWVLWFGIELVLFFLLDWPFYFYLRHFFRNQQNNNYSAK